MRVLAALPRVMQDFDAKFACRVAPDIGWARDRDLMNGVFIASRCGHAKAGLGHVGK
jgi:hypothetical protein